MAGNNCPLELSFHSDYRYLPPWCVRRLPAMGQRVNKNLGRLSLKLTTRNFSDHNSDVMSHLVLGSRLLVGSVLHYESTELKSTSRKKDINFRVKRENYYGEQVSFHSETNGKRCTSAHPPPT